MSKPEASPLQRLLSLAVGSLRPPSGRRRIFVALAYGITCHALFATAVLAMIVAMFFGMSESLGALTAPWSYVANAALILQFPLTHSFLLGARGSRILSHLAPKEHGRTLSTTTYATVASLQLLLLFALWTPSGVVWWRAEGTLFWLVCTAYAMSWLVLIKASYDAGAEVQSGALGWMSLMQKIKPVFPGMPTTGLFRFIRQPIYLSFALTLWTVPVWTPDQMMLAVSLTAYCLLAPRRKERRFERLYGERFEAYRRKTPYMIPRWHRATGRRETPAE
ncbi:MAG: isoprenylcysteine carboxylmethyltransferase family protein [Pseudomonadota bacterium]